MYNNNKKITQAQITKLVKAGKTEEVIEAYKYNKDCTFLNLRAEIALLTPVQSEEFEQYFTTRLKAGERNFYGLTESDVNFLIEKYHLEYLTEEKIEPVKELNEFQKFIADRFKEVSKNLTFKEFRTYKKNNKEFWYKSICKRANINPSSEDAKTVFNYLVY